MNLLWLRSFVIVAWFSVLSGTAAIADEKSKAGSSDGKTDWPQFLGPHRNGHSAETGLIDRIPSDGVPVQWRIKGGVGMSGVSVAKGRAVTVAHRDGKQSLLVLNALSGKEQHVVPLAPEYRNSMGNGTRATPTLDEDVAYAFTGEGRLAAVDLSQGTILWQRNVVEELDGAVAEYGMSSSPLLVGDAVVVTVGAKNGTLAAYHKKTGKPLWQAIAGKGADTAGYSSPTVLEIGKSRQIVAAEGKAVVGIEPATGELLWRFPYDTNFDCNIAVPLVFNDRVFFSAGENHGSVLLELVSKGKALQPKESWSSQGPQSVMRNEWQTSILLGDYLYGMDNVGGAGPVTHLNCVNLKTGERVWQEKRFGKGNLICAEGKLFVSTMKGELVIVAANPEKFEERGRTTLLGPTRQAPALSNGRLYLRDDEEIVCVDVRKK